MRLAAVTIRPTDNVVEITGANGAGKSSTLQAIWMALGGKAAIPRQPIKTGASDASIRIDLGDLIVTRTFHKRDDGDYSTTLHVTNKEGMRPQSPQTLLDSLVGKMAFDPLEFTRLKPADQYKTLRTLVPNVDFDAVEELNRQDFDKRTEVNRTIKLMRANLKPVDDSYPTEPINVVDLTTEIEQIRKDNEALSDRKAKRAAVAASVALKLERANEIKGMIAEYQAKIDKLQAERVQLIADASTDQARLDKAKPLPEPKNAEPLLASIRSAEDHNERYRQRKDNDDLHKKIADQEKVAEKLTAVMAERKAAMDKAVAEAKLPVSGLSLGDGEILLNGVAFDQASMAEQIRTSVAIAAAQNQKLRIAHIRDGSLLDSASWKALSDFANETDLQIWVETVDSNRPGAILIEDGRSGERDVEGAEG